jgi:hypothetical protein
MSEGRAPNNTGPPLYRHGPDPGHDALVVDVSLPCRAGDTHCDVSASDTTGDELQRRRRIDPKPDIERQRGAERREFRLSQDRVRAFERYGDHPAHSVPKATADPIDELFETPFATWNARQKSVCHLRERLSTCPADERVGEIYIDVVSARRHSKCPRFVIDVWQSKQRCQNPALVEDPHRRRHGTAVLDSGGGGRERGAKLIKASSG